MTKKRKNYFWDRKELSDNYSSDELEAWLSEIKSDPDSINPAHLLGQPINIYNKKAEKKMDSLTWAITYHIQKNDHRNPTKVKAERDVIINKKKKGKPLSSVIKKANAKNAPSDGWGDSDRIL